MRFLGIILLVGSLIVISVNLARFGSATVASARDGASGAGGAQHQAVLDVSDGVVHTVKYLVIPAVLLLVGGVLIRGGRGGDGRMHELRVDTDEGPGT